MPRLTHLYLRSGKQDFHLVPSMMTLERKDCYIQVKISMAFVKSNTDQYEQQLWDANIVKESVILTCVKGQKTTIQFSTRSLKRRQHTVFEGSSLC